MDYKQEIHKLRIQMAGDFDFVSLAMRDMGVTFRSRMDEMAKRADETARRMDETAKRMDETARRMDEMAKGMDETAKGMDELGRGMAYMSREVEERFNQVEGRTRLQEQRFGQMLVAVEGAVDDWKPEMEEVKARLDRLEGRNNSAA
ncbi:hypothetical protein IV102_15345 [bacterium]|nr:hypothetical protein [bacterium]